jgi:CRISPR-associated protein Cmr6
MIPDLIAALPDRIPTQFGDAAPGHKFHLYFTHWEACRFTPYKDAKLPDIKHLEKPERERIRTEFEARKRRALGNVCPLGDSAKAQVTALRVRQQAMFNHFGTNGYRISTTSTAPFATGLGNEHPIENGFAFLTPYGLPYLAGSGAKGILRRAAEELALENDAQDPQGWRWADVWWLFGFEGACGKEDKGSLWDARSSLGQAFMRDLDKTAADPDMYSLIRKLIAGDKKLLPYADPAQDGARQFLHACLAGKSLRGCLQARGALDFWDVFPSPAGGKLVVEIMTPHYSKYYQGDETPHDSGAPIPVSFLAVPAKSQFDFHVVCQPMRLPLSLQTQWRSLLDRAFQHAFEWVGFGAKTSVGYGAMAATPTQAVPPSASGGSASTSSANANTPAATASTSQTWPTAKLTLNPSTGEVTASFEGKSTVALKNPLASDLRAALGEDRANKLKKNKELKGVSLDVEPLGNALMIKRLTPS